MANGDERILVELDDLQSTIVMGVERAQALFPDERAQPYIQGWTRVAASYVPRLREVAEDRGEYFVIAPHMARLSEAASAFASASVTGDMRALHIATMAIAALPGDPTIGLPPPWELFAALGETEFGGSTA